ncbi:hypothetical protein EYF80_005036 [Liparis tanakae]|uniref:Uncharacterized protein n=1 Tax=Liparis tanakae TaxID=230148 RepID=A0A4Z2J3V2_9TELE|nr:hypothetical protein EYF80_005036 [Liparis tanakae]
MTQTTNQTNKQRFSKLSFAPEETVHAPAVRVTLQLRLPCPVAGSMKGEKVVKEAPKGGASGLEGGCLGLGHGDKKQNKVIVLCRRRGGGGEEEIEEEEAAVKRGEKQSCQNVEE